MTDALNLSPLARTGVGEILRTYPELGGERDLVWRAYDALSGRDTDRLRHLERLTQAYQNGGARLALAGLVWHHNRPWPYTNPARPEDRSLVAHVMRYGTPSARVPDATGHAHSLVCARLSVRPPESVMPVYYSHDRRHRVGMVTGWRDDGETICAWVRLDRGDLADDVLERVLLGETVGVSPHLVGEGIGSPDGSLMTAHDLVVRELSIAEHPAMHDARVISLSLPHENDRLPSVEEAAEYARQAAREPLRHATALGHVTGIW